MQYSVQIQVRLGEQMCTFLEKEGFLESFVCSIDEASEDEFIDRPSRFFTTALNLVCTNQHILLHFFSFIVCLTLLHVCMNLHTFHIHMVCHLILLCVITQECQS